MTEIKFFHKILIAVVVVVLISRLMKTKFSSLIPKREQRRVNTTSQVKDANYWRTYWKNVYDNEIARVTAPVVRTQAPVRTAPVQRVVAPSQPPFEGMMSRSSQTITPPTRETITIGGYEPASGAASSGLSLPDEYIRFFR